MTRTDLVRQMLTDGPVLARDLAIESGCPVRVASATLHWMETRGELASRRFHADARDLGCHSAKLYARALPKRRTAS